MERGSEGVGMGVFVVVEVVERDESASELEMFMGTEAEEVSREDDESACGNVAAALLLLLVVGEVVGEVVALEMVGTIVCEPLLTELL